MSAPPEPRFMRLLLGLLVRGDDAEFIHGDLMEGYGEVARTQGAPAARAWYRRQVLATVGSRLTRKPPSLEACLRDARLAARRARREPGYSAATILTLALGIAGAAAVGALAQSVLRPLPFPDAHELYAVWETRGGQQRSVAPANYLDWRRASEAFEGLAAHDTRNSSITIDGLATRERIAVVSGNYFEVLGISPVDGRGFDQALNTAFPRREAVLSHEALLRSFGDEPVLGRTFLVDDIQYEIVGVLPPGFAHPEATLFAWLRSTTEAPELRGFPGELPELRDSWYFQVVGRLADGATEAVARAEIETIADRLVRQHPDTNEGSGVMVVGLLDQTVAGFGTILIALALAVGLILVSAVFNVVHLTLARAEARRVDTAVRVSLGATREEIRRGLMVEGWLLGLAGAAAGIVLAMWGLDLLAAQVSEGIPRAGEIVMSPTTAVFAGALGLAVGTLIALATLARSGFGGNVRAGLVRSTGGGALIGVQVAGSIAILTATVLLAASFKKLGEVDLGFATTDLTTLRLSIPDARSRSYTERVSTYREVADAVLATPGVRSVGLGATSPLDMGMRAGVFIDGVRPEGDPPDSGWQPIDVTYFEAVGMSLLRGRTFTPADGADAVDVGVVNEAFARTVLGVDDPLGARVTIGLDGHDRPITIVGLVADTRTRGPASPAGPVLYRPLDQTTRFGAESIFVAVTTESGSRGSAPIRETIRRAAPGLPIYAEATGAELVTPFRAGQAMLMTIMIVFAVTALSIGIVGTYGVGIHLVRRRRRDIGVRMALGATAQRVTSEVMRTGLTSAGLGVLPGLALAFVAARAVESVLFEVSASDPRVPLLVAAGVMAVTAAAFAGPARVAAGVDPARATKDG